MDLFEQDFLLAQRQTDLPLRFHVTRQIEDRRHDTRPGIVVAGQYAEMEADVFSPAFDRVCHCLSGESTPAIENGAQLLPPKVERLRPENARQRVNQMIL